jgi:hypothetical protein
MLDFGLEKSLLVGTDAGERTTDERCPRFCSRRLFGSEGCDSSTKGLALLNLTALSRMPTLDVACTSTALFSATALAP